jgi:hypothetical protein
MSALLSLRLQSPESSQPVKGRGRGRPPLPPAVVEARARRQAQQAAEAEFGSASNPVDQARLAFQQGGRLSALVGLVLGGFVPLASYTLIHQEVAARPQLWALVAGGLVYSAISVYAWACQAFENRMKALGFVVLLEGTLTFCSVRWLSLAGLAILMVLNGVSAAVILQKPKEDS